MPLSEWWCGQSRARVEWTMKRRTPAGKIQYISRNTCSIHPWCMSVSAKALPTSGECVPGHPPTSQPPSLARLTSVATSLISLTFVRVQIRYQISRAEPFTCIISPPCLSLPTGPPRLGQAGRHASQQIVSNCVQDQAWPGTPFPVYVPSLGRTGICVHVRDKRQCETY